jgi:hypothetical protein
VYNGDREKEKRQRKRCILDGMGGSREQIAEELARQKKTEMKINIF